MVRLAAGLLILAVVLFGLSFWTGDDGRQTTDDRPYVVDGTSPAVVLDPSSVVQSPAEQGRALFQAKGCTTCHRHDDLAIARVADAARPHEGFSMIGAAGAPDLTHYRPDPDFVRRWLRDPDAVRPGTAMPNLHLNEDEIEALLAFLEDE